MVAGPRPARTRPQDVVFRSELRYQWWGCAARSHSKRPSPGPVPYPYTRPHSRSDGLWRPQKGAQEGEHEDKGLVVATSGKAASDAA
jgi:hypothetical protein